MRSRSVFVVLVSLVFLLISGQARAQAEELPNVALVPHASGATRLIRFWLSLSHPRMRARKREPED